MTELLAYLQDPAVPTPRPPVSALAARTGLSVFASDLTIPGPPASPVVTVSTLRPRRGRRGPAPCVISLHAGGFTGGWRGDDIGHLAPVVHTLGAVAICVEYRLAPASPFPAGVEDAYAVLQHVARDHRALGIDPSRVVLAGHGAGGTIAAAVALMARDRRGPRVAGVAMTAPALDDRVSYGPGAAETWATGTGRPDWPAYLGRLAGHPAVPLYAVPGRARVRDLAGFPPAYLAVGEADASHLPVTSFASFLAAAGTDLALEVYPGMRGGFAGAAPASRQASAERRARVRWLTRITSRTPDPVPAQ